MFGKLILDSLELIFKFIAEHYGVFFKTLN